MDAYRSRIFGPLLDRIYLHVEVPALAYDELVTAPLRERTAPVRARVESARAPHRERLKGSAIYCNAQMGAREVREHFRHDKSGARLLEGAMRALGLSARASPECSKSPVPSRISRASQRSDSLTSPSRSSFGSSRDI